MGRAPCCSKVGLMRGPWSAKEDALLTDYIQQNGEGQWRSLPKKAGLLRCGKSCRLRWMNYLRPGIKRGNISEDEEDLIVRLHGLLGNRWSLIAGRLPGRTDNEIKNYWNTYLLKKLQTAGINPKPNKTLPKPSKKSKKNNIVTSDDPANPKKKQNAESTGGQRDADVTKDREAKVNDDVKNSDGVAKVKVYFPKPMRVMPRTESRSSLASGAASSSTNNSSGGGAVVVAAAAEVTWKPVFELGEGAADYYGGVRDDDEEDGFLGGGNNDGFALPSLNHHQVDSVAMGGDDVYMFDALFDEYLQLLNFDN